MQQAHIFQQRRAGVLLHITSLPSGNLGEDAYQFIDFLQSAGVSIWQMLPLGPTHGDGSPYQCLSAHAGNPKLISHDEIKKQPWADATLLEKTNSYSSFMKRAYAQFNENAEPSVKEAFVTFRREQSDWLDDYVLFTVLKNKFSHQAWFDWPEKWRQREPAALKKFSRDNQKTIEIACFEQFLFFQQWHYLKAYANERGVNLFGDMPIFVAHDSADVWAEPELFTLDETGHSTRVAGVPPDYFSETGQRWGNPLYEWSKHIETGFNWWIRRLRTQLECFDLIRIDHFRGFEACWEIPASCETAIEGSWVTAPGEQLFDTLLSHFGELPLVAEDLGIITDEVTALREKYAMPGMKILHFAFGGDASNPYLPHLQCWDSVTYTGTHDNNTTLGWYEEIDEHVKKHISAYLGESTETMPWWLIRVCMQSVSQMAVVPMQDLLELDGSHRMNVPGTVEGNWSWQFEWDWLDESIAPKLKAMNALYGRV
jgi:4-alpha-glucanotransferase